MDIKYSGRGYTVHASSFQCEVKTTGGFTTDSQNPFMQPLSVDLNGTGNCTVTATGFNLDLANFVVYAEWQQRTTTDELSRAFGDTEAYYATFGYRIGKWLPHITFASIDGEASVVQPGAISDVNGNPTLPVPGGSLNFPVPIQTSLTAGLRYEVNDSAALKVEYQVVDVEQDPQTLADANQGFNYGLFNTNFSQSPPQNNVGIMSVALDVIF